MDVLTPEQRHRCMSRIRSTNTKPELVVRRLVHSMRYRYRLHQDGLPGKPDLVLPKYHAVIFVHGCFWHMHKCQYGNVTPKTNVKFWQLKRQSNVKRDRRNLRQLKKTGWRVLTVWECETRCPEKLTRKLNRFLMLSAC